MIFDGIDGGEEVSSSVVGGGVDNVGSGVGSVGSGAMTGFEPLRFPLQEEAADGFKTRNGGVQDDGPEARVVGIEESEASRHPSGQHDHHGEAKQSCLEQQRQIATHKSEEVMKTEWAARVERQRERGREREVEPEHREPTWTVFVSFRGSRSARSGGVMITF